MTCNRCNHKLPDDSEFCQYCGNKIEKVIEPIEVEEVPQVAETPIVASPTSTPTVVPSAEEEPSVEEMTPDEALDAILKMQAKNTIEAMEANAQTQPDNEGDLDFGLVPEKPIFTLALMSVDGEREYLNRLYTTAGEKIQYTRRGSTCVDGINGMIDVYDTFLPNGQLYKTIYINMYGAKKSTKAPVGFVLNNPVTQVKPSPKKQKPVKVKYCSRCGSVVDSKTKVCTGCGKRYFRGLRLTKFSVTIIILALIIATISTLCVLQYVNAQELQSQIGGLERLVNSKQSTITRLEKEVEDLEDEKWENWDKTFFFDYHAEIVGDDGTKVYHKYGCDKLDTENGFWIFNTEAADGKGYKECPHCH